MPKRDKMSLDERLKSIGAGRDVDKPRPGDRLIIQWWAEHEAEARELEQTKISTAAGPRRKYPV